MSGVNKVILMGHLGRDPEMRYQTSGAAIATLNMATSESFKDKEGNKQERTEWHRVVLFGRTAEVAGEYLRKGSMAYVEGRLQTRKWTDKEGQERYTTEIVGDRLQLVGSNPGNNGNQDYQQGRSQPQGQNRNQGNQGASQGNQGSSGNQGNSGKNQGNPNNQGVPGVSREYDPGIDYDDDIPF